MGESDIGLTYEILYELARKEKLQGELQELDNEIYLNIVKYLKEKKEILNDPKIAYGAEKENIRQQIMNAKKLVRDLFNKREKKIIVMAINNARAGSPPDFSLMLDEEKKFFKETSSVFRGFRQGVLDKLVDKKLPDYSGAGIAQETSGPKQEKPLHKELSESGSPDSGHKMQVQESSAEYAAKGSGAHGSYSSTDVEEKENVEAQNRTNEPNGNDEDGFMKVRFRESLTKFTGPGMKIYGPFQPGDEADLPDMIAKLLISKKKAEKA